MGAPSREQACESLDIIGLWPGSMGMGYSGTSTKTTDIVLGWGMQRDRMKQAGGALVIRNSAGARGCLRSPGVGAEGGENRAPCTSGSYTVLSGSFSQESSSLRLASPLALLGCSGQSMCFNKLRKSRDRFSTLRLGPNPFLDFLICKMETMTLPCSFCLQTKAFRACESAWNSPWNVQ